MKKNGLILPDRRLILSRRKFLLGAAAAICAPAIASAGFFQGKIGSDEGFSSPPVSSGGGSDSAAFTNFIARTTGLDATHTNAYRALLNGLTTDGIFDGSGNSTLLDVLYIFCTQDSTTALLNLVKNAFNGTATSAPVFTVDRGFDSNSVGYVNSNFNPSTAAGNYTQNGAHIGLWPDQDVSGGAAMGNFNGATESAIYPHFSDGNSYYRINDSTGSGGIAGANAHHYFVANRSGASAQQGYKDAVDQGVTAVTSGSLSNNNIFVVGENNNGTPNVAAPTLVISAAHIGGNLSATNVSNLFSRIGTFRSTVGAP